MKKTSLFFAFMALFLMGKSQCPSLTYNGKTYSTIQIGEQCWMAENLNDDRHTNGTSNFYYYTDCGTLGRFGRLYDYAAAIDIDSKMAGWHLPTNADWDVLANALGGSEGAGDKMKVGGSSDFNALFAGNQKSYGNSNGMGSNAVFWSSTPNGSGNAWNRYITSGSDYLSTNGSTKSRFSVRLLKD